MLRIASILWDYYPRPPQPINVGLLRFIPTLGTQGFTRFSRIQLCRRTSRHFKKGAPAITQGITSLYKTGLPARD